MGGKGRLSSKTRVWPAKWHLLPGRDESRAIWDESQTKREESRTARDESQTKWDESPTARDASRTKRDESQTARDTSQMKRDESQTARERSQTGRGHPKGARTSARHGPVMPPQTSAAAQGRPEQGERKAERRPWSAGVPAGHETKRRSRTSKWRCALERGSRRGRQRSQSLHVVVLPPLGAKSRQPPPPPGHRRCAESGFGKNGEAWKWCLPPDTRISAACYRVSRSFFKKDARDRNHAEQGAGKGLAGKGGGLLNCRTRHAGDRARPVYHVLHRSAGKYRHHHARQAHRIQELTLVTPSARLRVHDAMRPV